MSTDTTSTHHEETEATPSQSYTEAELVMHIEAILFWRGDPMSISALAKITSAEKTAITSALSTLRSTLLSRGIVLIEHDGEFTLGTHPRSAALIEKVRTEELSKDLGKASLETLAIILYQGPIRRSEIDYIRGVNSNFILRNLLIRGLIERTVTKESRTPQYSPTIDLLRFLGISHVSELDDFDRVAEAINAFRAADTEEAEDGLEVTHTAKNTAADNTADNTEDSTPRTHITDNTTENTTEHHSHN